MLEYEKINLVCGEVLKRYIPKELIHLIEEYKSFVESISFIPHTDKIWKIVCNEKYFAFQSKRTVRVFEIASDTIVIELSTITHTNDDHTSLLGFINERLFCWDSSSFRSTSHTIKNNFIDNSRESIVVPFNCHYNWIAEPYETECVDEMSDNPENENENESNILQEFTITNRNENNIFRVGKFLQLDVVEKNVFGLLKEPIPILWKASINDISENCFVDNSDSSPDSSSDCRFGDRGTRDQIKSISTYGKTFTLPHSLKSTNKEIIKWFSAHVLHARLLPCAIMEDNIYFNIYLYDLETKHFCFLERIEVIRLEMIAIASNGNFLFLATQGGVTIYN